MGRLWRALSGQQMVALARKRKSPVACLGARLQAPCDKGAPMLKLILIVVAVIIAGVLLFAASRPDTFDVKRSVTIQAPPEKIHPLINDLQAWRSWSPYEAKDPAMKRSFGTITAGKGATYAWDGNKDVGQGEMEISATSPNLVTMQLHFIKPFEGRNQADFKLTPQGDSTEVVWDMHGPAPFMNKLAGVFMNLDQMIGKDFEIGLANLKALAEK
jgi:Polyketide cyclase / dehydrase and lipid transport